MILKGEKKPVSEMDNAHTVIYEIYDRFALATYEQYQAIINHTEMSRIEMEAKYKVIYLRECLIYRKKDIFIIF